MTLSHIYFVQHGLAVDKQENPDRPLSALGHEQTEAIATHLQQADVAVSSIYHSGKTRALETAEIFASILQATVEKTEHLGPNDDVRQLADSFDTDYALYVGHLPQLDKLISYLLCGDEHANKIKFKNSAVICLEKSAQGYHVQWYLTPDLVMLPTC